jgi:hypothetical protein
MNYQDAPASPDDTTSVSPSVPPSVSPCLFLKKFYQFLAAFSSQNRQIDKIKIIKVPLMLI